MPIHKDPVKDPDLPSLVHFISLFQDNTSGILAAAISMICFGFADSLWKIPSQVFGASRTILFRNFFVLLVVLPYFIISERRSYIAENAIWASVGIAILAYFGLYFFAKATRHGLTSVVVPVSSTNTLLTLLLSIFNFDSGMNWISGLGVVAALTGLALLKVNWQNGQFKLVVLKESGIRYALLAAFFWGLSFGYTYYAVTFTGPALFTLILESIILVLALVHSLTYQFNHRDSSNPFKRSMGVFEDRKLTGGAWKFTHLWKQNWMVLALIGVLGAVGTIFNTIALDKASINTVTGIVVMAPLISVLFGELIYRERLTLQQRAAVGLIIAGVFVISYFRYY